MQEMGKNRINKLSRLLNVTSIVTLEVVEYRSGHVTTSRETTVSPGRYHMQFHCINYKAKLLGYGPHEALTHPRQNTVVQPAV